MECCLIPGYSLYKINRNGKVFRSDTGQRVVGSTNPKGYHNHRLKGDDGHFKTIGRHRLLAMTYIPSKEDISNLTVNHINGIKGDDRLENLEWLTYQQNQEHAGKNGLTSKCVPVAIIEHETGLETHYDSMIKCAIDLGVSKDTVAWRVSKGPNKVWPDGRRYKKTLENLEWGENPLKANGRKRATLVKDIRTGKTYIHDGLKEAARSLDINLGSAWMWANDPAQPVVPGFFLIHFKDVFVSWRRVEDAHAELQKTLGRRAVARQKDEDVDVFFSLTACAKRSNLKTNTLHFHLNKGEKEVNIGGYRFWYYDNLPEKFKAKVRLSSNR